MHTYTLKLEPTKHFKQLHSKIDMACEVYNYFVRFCRHYYHLYHKTIGTQTYTLQRVLTHLKSLKFYERWCMLNSQSLQDILKRIGRSYKLYFTNQKKQRKASPPKRRNKYRYYSITYTQTGYKIDWDEHAVLIQGIHYRFYPPTKRLYGRVKTVTVKRTKRGEFFVYIVTDLTRKPIRQHTTGKSVGVDFGLKTYMTLSDGNEIQSPLFFKQNMRRIKKLHKALSRKVKGSKHWVECLHSLQRAYEHTSNQRLDFHRKLALQLVLAYDVLCFETLNIKSMGKVWGRKVHDLGFSMFMNILHTTASKYHVEVVHVDRFYPSSQLCSKCGYRNHETKNLNVR